MGGTHAVIQKAKVFKEEGDLRFAATLLSHAVFANQENEVARKELADVFRTLGYGAESGPWRNTYLEAVRELIGPIDLGLLKIWTESLIALDLVQMFDSVAIRIDSPVAQQKDFTIELQVTDMEKGYLMTMSNGASTHRYVAREKYSEMATDSTSLPCG